MNETMFHTANNYLPFGGVGFSGLGNYHGKYTFDIFSHQKSILKRKGDKVNKFLMSPDGDKLNSVKRIVKFMEF